MNIGEHNKRVALSRWKNVRERERQAFCDDEETHLAKAALCGFLAGDGCIVIREKNNRPRYDVRFFPDDLLMLNTYLRFFEQIYGKRPTVRPENNFFTVEICSRSIGEDICAITSFGITSWSVPFFESLDEKALWLAAFFSAEGYVGPESIRVQTVNARGMRQVSQLLFDVGINHNVYAYTPRNPRHSTVHIVTILKRSARLRYAQTIGFWHAKKTEKLRKALDLKESF